VKGETNFSEKHWDQPTHNYGYLISDQLQDKLKEYIFTEARHFSKNITLHHDKDKNPVAEPSSSCHLMLVDII
jgi:hypothetical protein